MYCIEYKSMRERPETEFMRYNFVEVSGHNLESAQFETTFAGGEMGVETVSRGDCE
jgi:16S rRNA G966 N2-methylase RsmD